VTHEPGAVFTIGLPDEYPPGSRRLLQRGRVLILRDENGFRAISAVCTHLGCTVNLMDWGFSCPCHGSKFNWNGGNFAGPAPRPLAWHALSLAADGQLVVDTRSGRTVPPGQFFNPFA
jgi:cytochrome b6-f complex iron-sulfur subunit